MRTTIRLQDEFYEAVRARAAQEGKTVTELIQEALSDRLVRPLKSERKPFKLVPFVGGGGVMPGIDLSKTSALEDVLDEYDRSTSAP